MKINIILAGIIISLMVLVLPAVASDYYTLGVFGNANGDDKINMQDVTFTEQIIMENQEQTELSDAKLDGVINILDLTQIELIILGKEEELSFTDSRGKAITVNKPVERVILASSRTYDIMRAINVKEKVVGICKYKLNRSYYPELYGKWNMSIGCRPPDFENMTDLDPDLVIACSPLPTCIHRDEYIKTFGDLGIPLAMPVRLTGENLNETEIIKMGYIFNRVDEAEYYAGFINDSLDYLIKMTADIPEEDMPDVYIETRKNYSTYNTASLENRICEIAGGKNIACDIISDDRYVEVDPEWVMEQNPDIIIKIIGYRDSGYETDDDLYMKAARDEILNRSELSDVSAVKNGHVYVLSSSMIYSFNYVYGIPYYMKVFHPDLFSDLDPTEIHQEYVDFQGLDFDVKTQGIFIYPSLEES